MALFTLQTNASWPQYTVQVLPHPAQSEWHDLNDAGLVVGKSTKDLGWPTQTVAVVYDLAAPTSTVQTLGMLNAGANFNLSVAYRVSSSGRIIGWSRASNNRDQPVLFNTTGGGPSPMGSHANHTYGTGIGADNTRFLVPSAPGASIYNTSYTAYAISAQQANGYFDSTAMNASGHVAVVTQLYSPDRKEVRIYQLSPANGLSNTYVTNLSSAANPYSIYIRRMNNKRVIIGERSTGGLFYGYAYDAMNHRLYQVGSGGFYFYGLNEQNDIVGSALNQAFIGRTVESNLTVETVLLDTRLAAGHTGWSLSAAYAINRHGVIIAKGANAELGLSSTTYVALLPVTYVNGIGPQSVAHDTNTPGGVQADFEQVTEVGHLETDYDTTQDAVALDAQYPGLLDALDPAVPTNTPLQRWDLSFSGAFTGTLALTLTYDDALLPGEESKLAILHYDANAAAWDLINPTSIDTTKNQLTFSSDALSPFVLVLGEGVGEPVTTHPDAPPVPLSWLAQYRLTNALVQTFNEAVTNDADGDGMKAWQEYIAGTNPTNDQSAFRITHTWMETDPVSQWVVQWDPVTGRLYRVDAVDTLFGEWSNRVSGMAYPTNQYMLPAADAAAIRLQVELE